jgi:hypothetical protein
LYEGLCTVTVKYFESDRPSSTQQEELYKNLKGFHGSMLTDQIISGFLWYGISKAESSGFTVRDDNDSLRSGSSVNTITF